MGRSGRIELGIKIAFAVNIFSQISRKIGSRKPHQKVQSGSHCEARFAHFLPYVTRFLPPRFLESATHATPILTFQPSLVALRTRKRFSFLLLSVAASATGIKSIRIQKFNTCTWS